MSLFMQKLLDETQNLTPGEFGEEDEERQIFIQQMEEGRGKAQRYTKKKEKKKLTLGLCR